MSEANPIDRAALKNLLVMFNDDVAFLNQIIDTYLSDASSLLASIQQAVTAGKAVDLHRAAHSLKSNSANLGATDLSALARELEELGRTENLVEAQSKVGALAAELALVKFTLKKIRAEGL